ncbi:MAG: Maf family protein, partial [Candidatus Omnitrophica bacterium]|nr:Maf family protein [Candidatus Omnitrophota bacterium]
MKHPLILASQSSPRKRLLKQLGVPFCVIPSKVKEHTDSSKGCAALVKKNALLKARDVASRITQGIVVGSDTLVYIKGKKIIGKPRNSKEAKKNLKMLSQNPHWVYSGVAVVDAKTKKQAVVCEKTKIYMCSLSNKEI